METELKLELSADDVATLAGSPLLGGDAREQTLRAIYHDTPDETLRKAGFSLRVRSDGTSRIQTVKARGAGAAGLFVRPEWEREVPTDAPVIDAAAGPIAPLLEDQALQPLFSVEVRRRVHDLRHAGSHVELALDVGEIAAGSATTPLAELELELRGETPAALFDLARALGEIVPLRLAVLSKSERGYRLAAGKAGASKAEPLRLDPDLHAADAFAAICLACLKHFRLNEALLLGGETGPAALHQARVALRRLRSAFSLFKPLLAGDPLAATFAAALRELAGALGQVRDLDVLSERLPGAADTLRPARAAAFGAARARLEAPETRRLMLDLLEWLVDGAWRIAPAHPGRLREPVIPFAADLLDRRRRRLKRRGKHLSRLSEHDRHQVRIEAKKLRYAAEFFGSLWTGRKAARRRQAFLKGMEALQEELGTLNDAATGRDAVERLNLPLPPSADPQDLARTLADAEAAYEALRAAKPFWR